MSKQLYEPAVTEKASRKIGESTEDTRVRVFPHFTITSDWVCGETKKGTILKSFRRGREGGGGGGVKYE